MHAQFMTFNIQQLKLKCFGVPGGKVTLKTILKTNKQKGINCKYNLLATCIIPRRIKHRGTPQGHVISLCPSIRKDSYFKGLFQ
jgi:hypothetical protein